MKNRILSAFGSSLLGIISGLLTNLWLLRAVTQEVSKEDFGVYAFIFQITSYLAVLQLGLDFAGGRKIAESLGNGDSSTANEAYWEVFRFNRYSAALCTIVVLGVAGALGSGIGFSSVTNGKLAAWIALLTGGTQAISFVSRPYTSALVGTRHLAIVNLISVANTISTSLAAFALLRLGWGVLCIPAAGFIVTGLSLIALVWQTRRRCYWRTQHIPERNPVMMKSILSFGGLTTLGGIAWTAEATSDVIILGAASGSSAVALYVLWWRFPNMIFSLCSCLVNSAFPSFAERHGQSSVEAGKLLNKVSYLSIGLATLAIVGISLWLPAFMHMWVGKAYGLEQGWLLALSMALLVGLRSYGNLLSTFWLASGSAGLTTYLSWFQAIIKVSLALILVRSAGLLGLILASCIASLIQVLVVGSKLYISGFLKRKTIVHGTILTAVAIVVGALLGSRAATDMSIPHFAFAALVTSTCWAILWLAFAWHSELKMYLGSIKRFPKLAIHSSRI